MRKWLIFLVLIIVAVLGVLWWLGSSLDAHKPEAGEARMEIEHVPGHRAEIRLKAGLRD